KIGCGTQKVAGAADDLLALAWPGDSKKRDLGLMVYVAQRLQLSICKRTYTPEKPCVDVVRREAMKQCLQCPCVPGPSRTDHDLHALLKGNDTFLMDGICGLRGEVLLRPNVA